MSGEQYARRFSDPLLRRFFTTGDLGKMSAIAMIFSLAWMHAGNAGYCIGGSQAIIRLIEEKIASLGGKLRFNTKVERILVEKDRATGVVLENGEAVMGDWVISAADGHATIFEMLGGKYVDQERRRIYSERELFTSYLQVSLGVAMDLSAQPGMVTRILEPAMVVDPGTRLESLGFRIFHFDPSFAPPGRTAVTCFVPTRNFGYWTELRARGLTAYRDEKNRVAEAVTGVLEKQVPEVRQAIEVVDVSTPATVLRYTGNWKGAMEGWLVEPSAGIKALPNTLPGLQGFYMVGQWVAPGGGLPSGPMTARPAIKAICKHDHVPLDLHGVKAPEHEPVAA